MQKNEDEPCTVLRQCPSRTHSSKPRMDCRYLCTCPDGTCRVALMMNKEMLYSGQVCEVTFRMRELESDASEIAEWVTSCESILTGNIFFRITRKGVRKTISVIILIGAAHICLENMTVYEPSSWLIQTELMWERDRDQDQNRSLYIMSNFHTVTYVGTKRTLYFGIVSVLVTVPVPFAHKFCLNKL